mgnify:CR=1 FL=1
MPLTHRFHPSRLVVFSLALCLAGTAAVQAQTTSASSSGSARDAQGAVLPGAEVTLTEVPAMAISSTDCRKRTSRDEPIWYLVPDGVVQYIAKHDLYATKVPTA